MRRTLRALVFGAAITAAIPVTALPASACPYCDSDVGRDVAAGVFNEDFGRNALLTLLPIPVLLLAVALIHFGPPWPTRPAGETPGEAAEADGAAPRPSPRSPTSPSAGADA